MDTGRCRQLCGDWRLAFVSIAAGTNVSKNVVCAFASWRRYPEVFVVDRTRSPRAAEAAFRFVDRDHVVLGGEIPVRLVLPAGLLTSP